MIKYQLRCDADHQFEGWFRNSGEFDAQSADGLLSCPECGSARIQKAIMAPSISTSAGTRSARFAEIRHAMKDAAQRARAYVEKNFDYVGDRFPEEARKIHYGEVTPRSIYGEATGREVKDLVEEGVEVSPLPGAKRESIAAETRPAQTPAKKALN